MARDRPRGGVPRDNEAPRSGGGIIDGARARISSSSSGDQQDAAADEEEENLGSDAGVPLDTPTQGEAVQLILWYHAGPSGGKGKPIYSVDARSSRQQQLASSLPVGGKKVNGNFSAGEKLVPVKWSGAEHSRSGDTSEKPLGYSASLLNGKAKHYAQAALSSRVKLSISVLNESAYLLLEQVKLTDAGQYKCRVDFKFARTSYQVSQLDVIAPVTQLQINAPASDLWRPPELSESQQQQQDKGDLSSDGQQERAANKADRVDLQCASLDGWPNAKLAWWRLDWEPGKSRALRGDTNGSASSDADADIIAQDSLGLLQLTQLSSKPESSPNSLKVRRRFAHSHGEEAAGQQQDNERSYLISANKLLVGRRSDRITEFQLKMDHDDRRTNQPLRLRLVSSSANNKQHVAAANSSSASDTSETTADYYYYYHEDNRKFTDSSSDSSSSSSNNSIKLAESALLLWMQEKLIETLEYSLSSSLLPETSNLPAATNLHTTSRFQLVPLESLFSGSQSQSSPLLASHSAELWKLFCHKKLVLYTCGATNTNPLAFLPMEPLRKSNKQQLQRDKLASIPPVFTSLIGQANVRPKWVKLFLVTRKLVPGRVGRLTELSVLRDEQSLHLNLAHELGKASTSELHFACQVGDSQPEASIEWLAHPPPAGSGNQQQQLELLPDSQVETAALLSSQKQREAAHQLASALKCSSSSSSEEAEKSYLAHWSSFRLRNITAEQHGMTIECSALNDRYFLLSSQQHSRDESKVSARVSLNITHVPIIELELELKQKEKLNQGERSPITFEGDQSNQELQGGKVIVYGENLTLACNVNFANPALIEPIEWSALQGQLNDHEAHTSKVLDTTATISTLTLSPSGRLVLVHVLGKQPARGTNRHQFIERLTVQFSRPTRSQSSSKGIIKEAEEEEEEEEETKAIQQSLQLKCSARNALGRSASNTLKLLIGQSPRCYNTNNEANNNNNNQTKTTPISNELKRDKRDTTSSKLAATDKDQSVHCPVISEKSSTTFHWLIAQRIADSSLLLLAPPGQHLATTTSNLTNSSGLKLTSISLHDTKEPSILMSKLNSLSSTWEGKFVVDVLSEAEKENYFFYCYASDRFGSNVNSPCLIRALTGSTSAAAAAEVASPASASQRKDIPHNCNVSLSRNFPKKGNKNTKLDHLNLNDEENGSESLKKVFLIIECKDYQASKGIRSGEGYLSEQEDDTNIHRRLLKFDLYKKESGEKVQFIKHLAKKSVDWFKSATEQQQQQHHLVLELGNELDFSSQLNGSLKDIEDKHFIIMSSEIDDDDANNKRQFNLSLYFNQKVGENQDHNRNKNNNNNNLFVESNNKQGQQQKVATTDKFSRIGEFNGHQDRLWVISSLLFLLLSSFVLVIIGWVCRNNTSTGTEANGALPATNNTTTSDCNGSLGAEKTKTQGLTANKYSTTTNAAPYGTIRSKEEEGGCDDLKREMYPSEATNADWARGQVTSSTASSMNGLSLSLSQPVKLRPAVYHKLHGCQTTCSKTLVSATKQQQHLSDRQLNSSSHCKSTITSKSIRSNPYDFLIIDPTPIMTQTDQVLATNDDDEQHQKTILLIDPPSPAETHTTTTTNSCCAIKRHLHHHHVLSSSSGTFNQANFGVDKFCNLQLQSASPSASSSCSLDNNSSLQTLRQVKRENAISRPPSFTQANAKNTASENDVAESSATLNVGSSHSGSSVCNQVAHTNYNGASSLYDTCWRANDIIEFNHSSASSNGNKSSSSTCARQQIKFPHTQIKEQVEGNSLPANGYQTYELNSLGELTLLTDESWASSTFIQDSSDHFTSANNNIETLLHNKQSVRADYAAGINQSCCLKCADCDQSNLPAIDSHLHEQQTFAQSLNNGLLISNRHPIVALNGNFLQSPTRFVSSTQPSTTLQNKQSTISNQRTIKRSVERVKFMDVSEEESELNSH